jgi:hypothetical protein
MVQIPDSLRPYVSALVKHHFWILAAVVPLLLLPAVFSANGILQRAIAAQKSSIDGHLSALRSVQGEPEHPNDRWVESLDQRTAAIRAGILAEWEGFWESQEPLRVWPPELGADFVAAMAAVESGSRKTILDNLLQRYRNTVPDLVRQLPARMGCKELMGDLQGDGQLLPGGREFGRPGLAGGEDDVDSPEASLVLDPLIWRSEDQQKLFRTFVWQRVPSLTQVRLAQEELWIYGLFCDAIKKLNLGAKGAFDASITGVEELAVGYLAAEEAPGGVGGGRIIWKADPTALSRSGEDSGDGMPPMDGGMDSLGEGGLGSGAPVGRPEHPRFSDSGRGLDEGLPGGRRPRGGRRSGGEEAGEDGAAAITPEQALRQWIYVDFAGRPLAGPAVETAADAALTHLVPFTLRVVIDQRKIDRLLKEFADSAVPIDVRQVRINPASQFGGGGRLAGRGGRPGGGGGFEDMGAAGPGGDDRRRRPYDVTLELRGTVALATPPDPAVLGSGGEPDAGQGGDL